MSPGPRPSASRGPQPPTLPRFEPELAALGAGLALAGVDALLLRQAPASLLSLLAPALAVTLFSAALLALACRLALAMTRALRRWAWAPRLAGGLLALPVIIPVSQSLFRGTGISARWYAPYGPWLLAPLLLGLTVAGVALAGGVGRRLRGRRLRLLLTPAALTAAGLAVWVDHKLYPHQYAYLHWLLLLLSCLALMAAGWSLLAHAARPSRARWLAPALLALSLPLFAGAALTTLPSQRARQLFADRTHAAGRLVAVFRALLDFDGDRYSVIFGEQDCDNLDANVHPFAREVPGNGVDEDCDGTDALPPPPPPPPRRALDLAGYRRALPGWRRAGDFERVLARTGRYSVVLLVVDALRADQVERTPANLAAYPRLLRLLGESRWFRRAFSTGAGTDIGMATIFTGQLDPFDPSNRSVFALYRKAGFLTHGVFQREVERWLGKQFAMDGLDGRKVIVNDPGRRDVGTRPTAGLVTDEGLRFLTEHGEERFLLWLHYFDVHEHHQIEAARLPDPARYRAPRGKPFYQSLVRYTDGELGRFLDGLDAARLRERTIVVLLGDHGEGLAESPRLPANHGDVLFNPLVHVPLAVRIPGVPGAVLDHPVSVADLLPSLLDLASIEAPPMHGVSLLPHLLGLRGEELAGFLHPLLMYEAKQQAIIVWPWKFLTWLDRGLVELYDLEHDFAEEKNLADEKPELARQLAQQLAGYKLISVDRLKPKR